MEALATRTQSETPSVFFARAGAREILLTQKFLEFPVNPQMLEPKILAIRNGMVRLTESPAAQALVPWRTFKTDAYGPKYIQEVGIRLPEPGKVEQKFVFHYMAEWVEELRKKRSPAPLEYRELFRALYDLGQWGRGIAQMVAGQFDQVYGGKLYPGSLAAKIHAGTVVIRILRYVERDGSLQLLPDAKSHLDRSGFSIQLWASHEGIEFADATGTWHRANETSLDTAAIFPGEKFVAMTRGNLGYGTVHGVRDKRTAEERDCDRFAIVIFVHPTSDEADARWLLTNRHKLEAYEETLPL